MRVTSCALLVLLLVRPAPAADDAKPNTLTPKESADGWLLLFDGATTFGWMVDGKASVADGVLIVGGEQETTITTTCRFGRGNFSVQMTNAKPEASLLIEGAIEVLPFCKTVSQTYYTFKSDRPAANPIGFKVPAGGKLTLRNLKFRPLDLQPVFNGKDLTGWKEFPKRKSRFTVTPEGWLNIKNGPGDLQTEGQWADFVVQLDCISNGKHLNSGVFFRCRPNEYQQGYEAQIQNGFTRDPPKEYIVEEYDPQTHELKRKKTVLSSADDYGTGAIYRRMPARRQVAKDHEWFTMTIVAHGRHIATWVNGIQVVDWTDHRPLKDNARNGSRLEKGPISLQGHDPTTDLSFRNFRIAELAQPAEKK